MKKLLLLITHAGALLVGIGLGIYLLPILVEPESPGTEAIAASQSGAMYSTEFKRDLKGSDFLHWGEGRLTLTARQAVFEGELAPGPDYYLYLVPKFVEDEAGFLEVKDKALRVGPVKTFSGFILDLPANTDLQNYSAAVVWCERFGEFISAGQLGAI
ncbi:MAG: DM13 domain-containing protein [Burkholderiales bacterium]|jgi:hypothetical protein|uniref:DM13 domain-containing protein n=1 Tax=Limnobacter sp. TaxID=2003368 RepID=UPI0039BD2F4A|nr:DM13 domain-containing protein [Burkholderiales bacterium]